MKTTILYVVGKVYRPLERDLRNHIAKMAADGRPVRAEATQAHVFWLVEEYASRGRLDLVALYVPSPRNRLLGNQYDRGEEIDRMLAKAAREGAAIVYCGGLAAADEAMLEGATHCEGDRPCSEKPVPQCVARTAEGLVLLVASSYTDDWRQVVAGTDMAEAALRQGTPVFWMSTAKDGPAMPFAKGFWAPLRNDRGEIRLPVIWQWRAKAQPASTPARASQLAVAS